jgi:C1A family cysteine protease
MKRICFILYFLFIIWIAQSCGQKNHKHSRTLNENIVLSAFVDIKNPSTLDMEKLNDLPKIVDLKLDMTKVKNQERRGTCTFFSLIATLEAAIKKDLQVEVNISEEYLNFATKDAGYFSVMDASNLYYNLQTLKKVGFLQEKDWPYRPSWFENQLSCSQFKSTDKSAPRACFSHDRPPEEVLNKIISLEKFSLIKIPKNTNEIIKFLAKEKRPVTLGLMLNKEGWSNSGEVVYSDLYREECLKNSKNCGGHIVTITGYDLDKKIFFFKNSWGEEWGQQGYGTVAFEYVDQFSFEDHYSFKLNGPLTFSSEIDAESSNIENFLINAELKSDQSITVNMQGEIENRMLKGASSHTLMVTNVLVKMPRESFDLPNDVNTELINYSENNSHLFNSKIVKSKQYYSPELKNDNVFFSSKKSIKLEISSEMMNVPEVTSELKSPLSKVFLRTTVYRFTDSGFEIIKRNYQPLN